MTPLPPPSPNYPSGLSAGSRGTARHASASASSAAAATTSTRVIEELQSDVTVAKSQLERVREDLRLSQRLVGQLTRQNEDYRETKERNRGEIEWANKQVDRKQKLLNGE